MVICHCERVTEGRIRAAVAAGCATVRALGEATGAGTGCGGCVSSLKHAIEGHFATTSRMEIARAAT